MAESTFLTSLHLSAASASQPTSCTKDNPQRSALGRYVSKGTTLIFLIDSVTNTKDRVPIKEFWLGWMCRGRARLKLREGTRCVDSILLTLVWFCSRGASECGDRAPLFHKQKSARETRPSPGARARVMAAAFFERPSANR